MTEKQKRHRRILGLIASDGIGTQAALARALKGVGISATQSTLSKDIKELGVLKVPEAAGGFRYRAPTGGRAPLQGEDLLRRELSDFVVGVDASGNILVVKTLTGHAQGVCEAIDRMDWDEVVGTIAGENTIFVLSRSASARDELRERITAVTGEL